MPAWEPKALGAHLSSEEIYLHLPPNSISSIAGTPPLFFKRCCFLPFDSEHFSGFPEQNFLPSRFLIISKYNAVSKTAVTKVAGVCPHPGHVAWLSDIHRGYPRCHRYLDPDSDPLAVCLGSARLGKHQMEFLLLLWYKNKFCIAYFLVVLKSIKVIKVL